jgi:hypothetical protein
VCRPGGKTTHILEAAPQASVLAVDIDEQRLSRVYDNLKRLGMKAEVKQGDGRHPAQWCGDEKFDRILLDAPCSATGLSVAIRISNGCAGIVTSANLCNYRLRFLMLSGHISNLAGRWFMPRAPFCRKRTASKLPHSFHVRLMLA